MEDGAAIAVEEVVATWEEEVEAAAAAGRAHAGAAAAWEMEEGRIVVCRLIAAIRVGEATRVEAATRVAIREAAA